MSRKLRGIAPDASPNPTNNMKSGANGMKLATNRWSGPAAPVLALSLRANVSWTFAGSVVYMLTQWGILIALARLGSAEQTGRFAYGLAVTGPIILLSNLQLRTVQATDARGEFSFADYLGLRLLTTALAIGLIVVVCQVTRMSTTMVLIVLAVAVAKAVESISDVCYGLFQKAERMDIIARSLIARGLLSLTAFVAALYWGRTLVEAIVVMAGAWAVVLVLHDCLMVATIRPPRPVERLRPRWHGSTLRSLAWISLPAGLVTALVSLEANLPRYFIEHIHGERLLGVFALLAYFLVGGSLLSRSVNQSATPRLARYYATGARTEFARLVVLLVALGATSGVLGIALVLTCGRTIIGLVCGTEYVEFHNVLFWLTVAAAVRFCVMPMGDALRATRKFWWHFSVQVSTVCVLLALCRVTIPNGKLVGAAVAIALAAVPSLVVYPLLLWRAVGATRPSCPEADVPPSPSTSGTRRLLNDTN